MPRKGPILRRTLNPDPVYGSELVTQLINRILQRGLRAKAEQIVYEALTEVSTRTQDNPLQILERAIENIRPQLEVRSRRVGGSTYQVPLDVKPVRQTTLAVRWLVIYARKRREKTMSLRLAEEILDASKSTGLAVKRKEDLHKTAASNKAFAHYRW